MSDAPAPRGPAGARGTPVPGLSAHERWALFVVSALYAAVVIPIGIHKGPDVESHLALAGRLLGGQPLFNGNPTLGVWWPPFALLVLVPFSLVARLSLPVAKGAYALLSVACVGWSMARLSASGWRPVLLALAAVAVPLQTNFEYLNINAVLLALVVAAGQDLEGGRDGRAGVWIGLATALKVFPGLLLLYAAARGRWRAAATAATIALAASVCALLPYGVAGGFAAARDWMSLTLAGSWLPHLGNQSLAGLVGRAGAGPALAVVVQLGILLVTAVALWRRAAEERIRAEVGAVTLLAVLLSPIAWSHAFLLAFPAWVAALEPARERRSRASLVGLLVAGIATSGFLTIWSRGFKLELLAHAIYTWGGALLLALLVIERTRRQAEFHGVR